MTKNIEKIMNHGIAYMIQGSGGGSEGETGVYYLTQEQYNALTEAEKTDPDKNYFIYSEGDINPVDDQSVQLDELPVASATEVGAIHQYTGETTGGLTNGYFYKCVSDGQDPATYSWEPISVQQGGGSGTANIITYDNTTSGLTATNVQDAIDEIAQGGSGSSSVTFIEVGDSDLTYDSANNRYNISSTKATEIMTARTAGKNIVLCVTANNQVMLLSNIGGGSYYVDFSGFREVSSTGVKSWIGHIELDGSSEIRSAYIKMNKEFDTMTRMTFYTENSIYTYNSTLDRYVPADSFANDYRENVEYSGEYVIQLRNSVGRAIDTLQLVKREFSNGEYARYDICGRVKYDSSNTAKQIHIHLEFDGSNNYLVNSSTYETKTITYAS